MCVCLQISAVCEDLTRGLQAYLIGLYPDCCLTRVDGITGAGVFSRPLHPFTSVGGGETERNLGSRFYPHVAAFFFFFPILNFILRPILFIYWAHFDQY